MQGTAADLIKLAMASVRNFLDKSGLTSKLIMQVHDELVLEVPEKELAEVNEKVRVLMQDVAKLDVALVACAKSTVCRARRSLPTIQRRHQKIF
jgi:DNA polymerase-1